MKRLGILGALILAMAAPAAAQEGGGSFIRGLGGLTFGTEQALVVGGGVGVRVASNVQVYFEGGYITSILPRNVIDQVESILDDLDQEFVDLELGAPALYGLFGVRFDVPTGGRIRPFVEALFGFARVTADFSVTIAGIDFDIDDLPIDVGLSSTEPAIAFGGGVYGPAGGRVGFEAGYRFFRLLVDEEPPNVSQVYVAVRIGM
jgi:hypothetical protein